jgi:hypothetical protein
MSFIELGAQAARLQERLQAPAFVEIQSPHLVKMDE